MRLCIWPLGLLILCLPVQAQMIAAQKGENLPPVNMTDTESTEGNGKTSNSDYEAQMQEENPHHKTRDYYNDEEDAETQEYIDENFDEDQ